MDNAVRKALKKQKELLLEVDRLERFISTYEELTGDKIPRDEMVSPVNDVDKTPQNKEQTVKEAPKRRRNNLKRLLSVSERLINEAQRPLTRTELAEGMERLKVVVHATDIPKYLGTLLWRNPDRFVSSDGDGYMTVKLRDALAHGQHLEDLAQDQKALTQMPGISRNNDLLGS